MAIIATAGKRTGDRITLSIPTALHPCSAIDAIAKPGDLLRFDGEVMYVDKGLGRVTIQVLGAEHCYATRLI